MTNELHLNDLFWTFQGEGFHSGRRALFVRMPFCNLSCEWCDTKFNTFHKWEEKALIDFATEEPGDFAVITGGEPMLHKHTSRVLDILHGLHFEVAAESNGTAAPVKGFDFITVSPKRQSSQKRLPPYFIHDDIFGAASEFKYVVDSKFDFSVLERHDTLDGRRYSLSPEFNDFDLNASKIMEYVKENPEWRISLQTHKWLKIP